MNETAKAVIKDYLEGLLSFGDAETAFVGAGQSHEEFAALIPLDVLRGAFREKYDPVRDGLLIGSLTRLHDHQIKSEIGYVRDFFINEAGLSSKIEDYLR